MTDTSKPALRESPASYVPPAVRERRAPAPIRADGPGNAFDPGRLLREQQARAAQRGRQRSDDTAERRAALPAAEATIDAARLRFVDPADALAIERIIGASDLVPINFLAKGLAASRPVCRIQIRNASGRVVGFGTGSLVAPGLLMTNNHVLPTAASAVRSLAEFDFEDDIDAMPKPTRLFKLLPDTVFVTDERLDFTLVAVAPTTADGTTLASYGFLRLSDDPDKLLKGEYVSVIQHPEGNTKQIALRENQVVWFDADFLHYETDTQPGSSGSPAFSDDWFVVALHHSGVPRTDAQGNWLKKDGTPWRPGDDDDAIDWIANEGVRISRIFAHLEASNDPMAAKALSLLRSAGGGPETVPVAPPGTDDGTAEPVSPAPLERAKVVRDRDPADYEDRRGYDEAFLGRDAVVPLPPAGADEEVLAYENFSIVHSLSRKLARLTVVNIDGVTWKSIKRRRPDVWAYDPRIDERDQAGRELYDGTRYDFGHLVRRQDACSGADPRQGERDTFHLTNAAPQDHELNTGPWNDLENHVLDTIKLSRQRVSVLTGPVFRDDDPVEFGHPIPQDFFKIVAYLDEDGRLAAAGWVQRQPEGTVPTEAAARFVGRFPAWQVPIATIAAMTGLDLGPLVEADALAVRGPRPTRLRPGARRRERLEAMRAVAVPLASPDDLVL